MLWPFFYGTEYISYFRKWVTYFWETLYFDVLFYTIKYIVIKYRSSYEVITLPTGEQIIPRLSLCVNITLKESYQGFLSTLRSAAASLKLPGHISR